MCSWALICALSAALSIIQVLAQDSPLLYAPQVNITCPTAKTLVRTDGGLSPSEISYVASRQEKVASSWKSWIGNGSQIGYDFSSLEGNSSGSNLPKLGIAMSGGGLKATQYAAGVLSALDGRNASAVSAGSGGLLQTASYMTALSGGSWALSSFVFNNMPPITDLVLGNDTSGLPGWQLNVDPLTPDPTNASSATSQAYFGAIFESIGAKAASGLPISFIDVWGRAQGYHMLNGTTPANFYVNTSHGAGQLWSNIPQIPNFQSFDMPFPIVYFTSRPSTFDVNTEVQTMIPISATVYEINAYEFGTWDPNLSAFVDVRFVGTKFNNGTPTDPTNCVNGFDQAAFVMGSSADVYNQILAPINSTAPPIKAAVQPLLQIVQSISNTSIIDAGNWPNPFKGLKPSTFVDSSADILQLVDGSEQGESIPLEPLLHKDRGLEVIIALDANGDTPDNWPSGIQLYGTQNRTNTILSSVSQKFPPLPPNPADFFNWTLNRRPTFLGCDPTQNPPEWPLIIYLPNAPPLDGSSPVTNTPLFLSNYTIHHTSLILDVAYNLTTQGYTPNSQAPDPNFGKCLQCAAVDRARLKATPPINRSEICTQCFATYCYDPNATNPPVKVVGRNLTFVDPDASSSSSSGTGPASKNAALVKIPIWPRSLVWVTISLIAVSLAVF